MMVQVHERTSASRVDVDGLLGRAKALRRLADQLGAQARSAVIQGFDASRRGRLSELSPQQRMIAQLTARGLSNREIAARLYLSPRTVSSHLYRIFPRLGVTSRSQLAGMWREWTLAEIRTQSIGENRQEGILK